MEKLLTTQQVADRLNMHPKTLYRALRENTIDLNYIQISPRRFGFQTTRCRTISERPRDCSHRRQPQEETEGA